MNFRKKYFPADILLGEQVQVLSYIMDKEVFTFPFYNDGVVALNKSVRRMHQDGFEYLNRINSDNLIPHVSFVFHSGHAGSTLLSNMLKVSEKVRVVSECEVFNGIFMYYATGQLKFQSVSEYLRKIVLAFRQRIKNEDHVIFKMASWNVFMLREIYQIFPDSRFIYIDRNSDELVASLLKSENGFTQWYLHASDILVSYFIGPRKMPLSSKKLYLESFVQSQKDYVNRNIELFNATFTYPSFIQSLSSKVLPTLGLVFDKNELLGAKEISKYQSKSRARKLYVAK